MISPVRNASNSRWRSLDRRLARDDAARRAGSASSSSWSRYWPMTSVGSPACRVDERLDDRAASRRSTTRGGSARRARSTAYASRWPSGRRDAHLDAVGGGDVALRLDVLPRRVEALGADEAEDVALAAVLAHQRGGQPEPAARLQVGRHAEDRRGQQVHLVVDDQAPVAGVEQVEVGVGALPPRRQHLVGRDGDRADLLAGAGVLADLVLGQRGPLEQLVLPLPRAARCS